MRIKYQNFNKLYSRDDAVVQLVDGFVQTDRSNIEIIQNNVRNNTISNK